MAWPKYRLESAQSHSEILPANIIKVSRATGSEVKEVALEIKTVLKQVNDSSMDIDWTMPFQLSSFRQRPPRLNIPLCHILTLHMQSQFRLQNFQPHLSSTLSTNRYLHYLPSLVINRLVHLLHPLIVAFETDKFGKLVRKGRGTRFSHFIDSMYHSLLDVRKHIRKIGKH